MKMRSQEKAVKDICRALDKAGVEYSREELRCSVQALYLAWESDGAEPTCSRLADLVCDSEAAAEVIRSMERDPFLDDGRGKKKAIGIAAGAVAAIVLVGLGAAAALGLWTQADPEPTPASSATQTHEAAATCPVTVVINAEGAEQALTPAKFEILDAEGTIAVAETETAANRETRIEELEAGSYSLRVTAAPILEDGSTYTLPDETAAFEVVEGDDPVTVAVTLARLDANDMTKEQLEAAAAEVRRFGNESAAQAILDKAALAQSELDGDVAAPADSASAQSKPSNGDKSGGGSGSSRPAGNGGASGSAESSESDHVHNWVERTTEKWVIDQQPWWEEIPIGTMWHCKCGASFTSEGAIGSHLEENALAGDLDHSYWVETVYDEVYHDAEGHYETIVVGYVCSVCGMRG